MNNAIKNRKKLIYNKFFSKKVFYNVYKIIINFIKLILAIKQYIFKTFLFYLIYFIKRSIPTWIKIRIRYKLIFYPKLIKFLKILRNWLKNTSNPKKIFFINYLLSPLIRLIFLPILNAIINNNTWRIVALQQLKPFPALRTKFKHLLYSKALSDHAQRSVSLLTFEKNIAISSSTQKIYNDLKLQLQHTKLMND